MEHNELLLGLVPIVDKGQELIPHKDYEIKQDGKKFYLVKKKKEYPKTYEECCKVLGLNIWSELKNTVFDTMYKRDLMNAFHQLLICRDAYWKIAGEEMGLEKPWEPSGNEDCFVITRSYGEVILFESVGDCELFEFPTEEMRDAFYENFKDLIEQCKELL